MSIAFPSPSAAKDKILFTPGPLTTSASVKQAMLRDLGAHDRDFIEVVRRVRAGILELAGVTPESGYESVPMQGSGSFGVEAAVTTSVPPTGKILVVSNGAYGRRMAEIARVAKIDFTLWETPEDEVPPADELDARLDADSAITHVGAVHLETTSGILNPIDRLGCVAKKHGKTFLVDAMSSFGAVPIDLTQWHIDFLVSSSNKCIEGAPGFSFVICRRDALLDCQGNARSLCLDLVDQWKTLENTGQFRFTPATHAFLACERAIQELREEGGVAGRAARYRSNHRCLVAGMRTLGFREYLRPELQGYIITSFRYLDHPHFSFERFFEYLRDRGYIIYLGKVVNADCFRIANIGRIFPSDVHALLLAVKDVLQELNVL